MAKGKKKEPEEVPPELTAKLEELEKRAKELGMTNEELLWTHTIGNGLKEVKERIRYLEEWIAKTASRLGD